MAETTKKDPPRVTVSSGKVDRTIRLLIGMFEKHNPGHKARFAYAPLNRPELSTVTERLADGYRIVRRNQMGDDDTIDYLAYDPDGKDVIRVGDAILMSVSAEQRAAIKKEVDARARDQRRQVDRDFYEKVGKVSELMKPMGRTEFEMREENIVIQDPKFAKEETE